MTKLKSEHVLEKCRDATKEVFGVDLKDLHREPTLEEMDAVVSAVKKIELDGVCEYSSQFANYISGFRLGELPYILAGMRLAIRSLYNTIPGDCQKVRDKYKEVNELAKKCVETTVGYAEHTGGQSDA